MVELTREKLLKDGYRKVATVQLASGQVVYIRLLTEADLIRYDVAAYTGPDEEPPYTVTPERMAKRRALLVALCLVDKSGEALFEASEAGELRNKVSGKLLSEIHEHCTRVNGLDGRGADDDAEIKAAEKNSESAND